MSTGRTLVAGVDSSTQSTKVVVCDAATGDVVRTARAPHPDGTEVHPDRWWAAYEQACDGGLLDGVAAVAVGGQQHGIRAMGLEQGVEDLGCAHLGDWVTEHEEDLGVSVDEHAKRAPSPALQ